MKTEKIQEKNVIRRDVFPNQNVPHNKNGRISAIIICVCEFLNRFAQATKITLQPTEVHRSLCLTDSACSVFSMLRSNRPTN